MAILLTITLSYTSCLSVFLWFAYNAPLLFPLALFHKRKQRRIDFHTEEDCSSDSIRSGGGIHRSTQ